MGYGRRRVPYEKVDPAVREARFARLERPILDSIAGDLRVLDLGCGTGRFTEQLRVRERVGVDPDRDQLAIAKQLGFPVVLGDAHALPFRDASFDAIVATDFVFYYLAPLRALAECARVLTPTGRLVLHYPTDKIWSPLSPLGLTRIERRDPTKTASALIHAAHDAGFVLEKMELWRWLRFRPYLMRVPSRPELRLWTQGVFWLRRSTERAASESGDP